MNLFYPRSTRPWMVYKFILSFPVRLFSRLASKAASNPIVFTPDLWRGFHLTIGFVYFYKVIFQNLGLLVKTWGLWSVLKGYSFRSSLSDIFLEEAPKLSAKYISWQFLRQLLRFSFRSIILAVTSLVVGLLTISKLDSLLRDTLYFYGPFDD